MSNQALQMIAAMKDKVKVEQIHFESLQDPVPQEFSEKLQQIEDLEQSIQVRFFPLL